jgi:hypothetical protein
MGIESPQEGDIEEIHNREKIEILQELRGPLSERLSLSVDSKQWELIKNEIFDKHNVSREEVEMISEDMAKELHAKFLQFVEMKSGPEKDDLAREIAEEIRASAEMFV